MAFSNVGAGLLAGFGGALGAAEQDYQQNKANQAALSLEDYRLQRQKELAAYKHELGISLGDIEHKQLSERAAEKAGYESGAQEQTQADELEQIRLKGELGAYDRPGLDKAPEGERKRALDAAKADVGRTFNDLGSTLGLQVGSQKWDPSEPDFEKNIGRLKGAAGEDGVPAALTSLEKEYHFSIGEVNERSTAHVGRASGVYDDLLVSIKERVSEQYGDEPLDDNTGIGVNVSAPEADSAGDSQSAYAHPTTEAEMLALPPGTVYIDPKGTKRTR